MAKVPSLIDLCSDVLAEQLLCPFDDLLRSIYLLPSHLLHALIQRLPPMALRTLHHYLNRMLNDEDISGDDSTIERKRTGDWNLNLAWERLFRLRWPENIGQIQPTDWQQLYWESHVQNCLDEAAEIALIPMFSGCIADIQISDSILKYIGFVGDTSHSTRHRHCSKLFYHCLQFGTHVSCLRLQNVLCTTETCVLLSECKLQSLVVRCIRSEEQVDGLCTILAQHCRTLTSLEFFHCTLSTHFFSSIFGCIVIEDEQKHGIQHLSIVASSFQKPSLPIGLMYFLSSGRSLCSLKLSDNHHGRTFAKSLLMTLLNLSSGISVLDLSYNNIAGWLSDFNRRFSSDSHLCYVNGKTLKMLRVLTLRESSLGKDDAESLRYALEHMPNLEELDISDNPIEDEGIRNFVPYFVGASDTCPHINCLKLENCDLSSVGVNLLLYVLSACKATLKSLSIADNYLGSTPIEVLDIAGIGLGSSGFQELQNLIKEELKLMKINISKNRGGIETAKFLSKLLSRAPQLVEVNATCNLMPIDSLAVICSALKFAKGNVKRVDLRGHIWNYKPEQISLCREIVHDGLPILVLPLPSASAVLHDHDP